MRSCVLLFRNDCYWPKAVIHKRLLPARSGHLERKARPTNPLLADIGQCFRPSSAYLQRPRSNRCAISSNATFESPDPIRANAQAHLHWNSSRLPHLIRYSEFLYTASAIANVAQFSLINPHSKTISSCSSCQSPSRRCAKRGAVICASTPTSAAQNYFVSGNRNSCSCRLVLINATNCWVAGLGSSLSQ